MVGDTAYVLARSMRGSSSWFGGPMEGELVGPMANAQVHHVATLSSKQVSELALYSSRVALVYGMQYEGCLLEYVYDRPNVRIHRMTPSVASVGWPYHAYPAMLPFVPLEVVSKQRASWSEFCTEWPNLPQEQPAEMVVVVPPPATIGVSLWGVHGDWERVTLVFEVHLSEGRVSAYNVCS